MLPICHSLFDVNTGCVQGSLQRGACLREVLLGPYRGLCNSRSRKISKVYAILLLFFIIIVSILKETPYVHQKTIIALTHTHTHTHPNSTIAHPHTWTYSGARNGHHVQAPWRAAPDRCSFCCCCSFFCGSRCFLKRQVHYEGHEFGSLPVLRLMIHVYVYLSAY